MNKIKFNGHAYGETDQGLIRDNNEDSFICQNIWDDRHILCAAIDGMGGYEGGEIAAEISRETIIKHLEEFASNKVGDLLRDSLIDANNEIIRQHQVRPKVAQMGCVASLGLIDLDQGTITIAHVGDSRIYQFKNGELKKLTHDHSLVGYREEIGEMSEEDAMRHPKRNVIDKYLGEQHLSFDSTSYIEISVWPIVGDTQYLFCSDGLTDLVTGNRISSVLSSATTIEDKVRKLINLANDAGGKDNITAVIVDVNKVNTNETGHIPENTESEPDYPINKRKKKASFIIPLIWILIGIIIGFTVKYLYDSEFSKKQEIRISDTSIVYDKQQCINDSLNTYIRVLEDSISKLLEINANNVSNQIESDSLQTKSER